MLVMLGESIVYATSLAPCHYDSTKKQKNRMFHVVVKLSGGSRRHVLLVVLIFASTAIYPAPCLFE